MSHSPSITDREWQQLLAELFSNDALSLRAAADASDTNDAISSPQPGAASKSMPVRRVHPIVTVTVEQANADAAAAGTGDLSESFGAVADLELASSISNSDSEDDDVVLAIPASPVSTPSHVSASAASEQLGVGSSASATNTVTPARYVPPNRRAGTAVMAELPPAEALGPRMIIRAFGFGADRMDVGASSEVKSAAAADDVSGGAATTDTPAVCAGLQWVLFEESCIYV